MKCQKCNGTTSMGFIVDYGAGGKRQVEKWVAGEPKPSYWYGVDIKNQDQIEVVTYRCDECGYLESYAPKPGMKDTVKKNRSSGFRFVE